MRTFTFLPLALALIGATAYAAPQSDQTEPTLGEIQVRATAPTYKPTPMELAEVKGTYALDNGASLKISNEHRRLFARLGDRLTTELVPVGENRFVSADQRMTIEYIPIAFGDQILLTYPADMNLASSPMITVRLAAN
jgi:hypothetical protein